MPLIKPSTVALYVMLTQKMLNCHSSYSKPHKHHTTTSQTPHNDITNTTQTRHKHHINTTQTLHKHHTNTTQAPHKHHTNTTRTPHKHHSYTNPTVTYWLTLKPCSGVVRDTDSEDVKLSQFLHQLALVTSPLLVPALLSALSEDCKMKRYIIL